MSPTKRMHLTVLGSVQGVGFRPFVFRLAQQHLLVGSIKNTTNGVEIDVQGKVQAISDFERDLVATKPERAIILEIMRVDAPERKMNSFEIAKSESGFETTLALLPDSAICPACMRELQDPTNRRYRYPFLHCMTCGPRFSIFTRMPFDRAHTTMIDFTMCDACQKEYCDPTNRRFYSQTNCCPACGPKLQLFDPGQNLLAGEAIDMTEELLRQGKIVAVKNTGGFLLLVDATNPDAVNRLRFLKQRAKKPFALLVPTLLDAQQIAAVCPASAAILTSPAAPIVLLKKLPNSQIAPSVACESPYYGIMLAHNALQYLLLEKLQRPLVATSGNISGRLLCITEEEAFSQLSSVADAFLIHNRRIIHRLDDSIVQIIDGQPMIIRRARGYVPSLISIPEHLQPRDWMIASGGHQKNSFAFAKDHRLYLSQYIGDLDSVESCRVYDNEVASWESLLNMTPKVGIGDSHPDYYTSHYIQKRNIGAETVQHHRAHVYSGMADNQLSPPLLCFSWDGTGLGDDQTIWGGEAFIVTKEGARHFASLFPFRLPGSEKAIKEPRRSALGLLDAMFGSKIPSIYQRWITAAFSDEECKVLSAALTKEIHSPQCSSMGRLFDAVSALLTDTFISDYEGHAALVLESLARESALRYTTRLIEEKTIWRIDWRPMIEQIWQDKMNGRPLADIAFGFHDALAAVMVAIAEKAGLPNVLLTGGVMQNKLLVERAIALLRQSGFQPFWHHQIPPNDGGLAVGQIMGRSCV